MRILFILFVVLYSSLGIAQTANDKLDYNTINLPFLEHLIKTKIDSFRINKGLDKFRSDSLLYLPACDQTKYMMAKNKLSHFQKKSAKYTPQQRFKFYEINHVLAGENVQYIPINTTLKVGYQKQTVTINTYNDLANVLAMNWKYSKPHYANILTKAYSITAICVKVDIKTKVLWATQVFGEINGFHAITKTNASFPYEVIEQEIKKKE